MTNFPEPEEKVRDPKFEKDLDEKISRIRAQNQKLERQFEEAEREKLSHIVNEEFDVAIEPRIATPEIARGISEEDSNLRNPKKQFNSRIHIPDMDMITKPLDEFEGDLNAAKELISRLTTGSDIEDDDDDDEDTTDFLKVCRPIPTCMISPASQNSCVTPPSPPPSETLSPTSSSLNQSISNHLSQLTSS